MESLFSQAEINDCCVTEIDTLQNVVSEEYLYEIIERIRKVGECGIDIETTGLEVGSDLVGIGLCWKVGKDYDSVYIPVGHITNHYQLPISTVRKAINSIADEVEFTAFNLGFEMKHLEAFGFKIQKWDDARYYCISFDEENYQKSLKDISEATFGVKWGVLKDYATRKVKERNAKGKLVTKEVLDVAGSLIPQLGKYCREDTVYAMKLRDRFKPEVEFANKIISIERALTPVVVNMELNGITIDRAKLAAKIESNQRQLDDLIGQIYSLAEKEINLNSPAQLSKLLFEDLKLPRINGNSTDVSVLQTLKEYHEVPRLMLEYRDLEKLRGTYLIPIYEKSEKTGRIYTSLNQLGTRSGRFSSSDP